MKRHRPTPEIDGPTPEVDGPALAELLAERERDHFHDECGVFGVQGHPEAANITYLGLYALQHRGQESCGITSSNGGEHFAHRAMGLVADAFSEPTLRRLPGRSAIGHVRYSTAGESQVRNAQPFVATTDGGGVAIAHNGNLVNAMAIRRELEGRGAIFSTTADSEVIVQLLARSREQSLEERLIDALSRVKGAFSLVMLTPDALIAARFAGPGPQLLCHPGKVVLPNPAATVASQAAWASVTASVRRRRAPCQTTALS